MTRPVSKPVLAVSTDSGFVFAERSARPSPPRLPALAGMTEAGFNRVVAMIQLRDFGVPVSPASERRYRDWRASLPKTRNKKQRKADAKRAALRESAREQFEAIFPPVQCCVCDKKLGLFDDWARGSERYCHSCYLWSCPPDRPERAAGTPFYPQLSLHGSVRIEPGSENERILREIIDETPPEGDVFVDGMPFVDALEAAVANQTPLQRLMRFAAEDGTPVSFEIAEAARKGEW